MKCYDVNIRKYILLKCIKRIIYYMIFFFSLRGDVGHGDAIFGHSDAIFGRGDAIFGRRPSTYSKNPIDCRDAIFGRSDLHFQPRLGVQYKFTESSGISGCCLSWAGISLWLGCARILVSLFGFERGAI